MPDPIPTPQTPLAERAIARVRHWVAEAAIVEPDAVPQRLADVLGAENGLPFALGLVDAVLRPENLTAAAAGLQRVAPLVPDFLPWYLRGAVRLGGGIAPALPAPTVPLARRMLRELVGHLVVDARPARLGAELARIRESGAEPVLVPLGEAVLGEAAAQRRLDVLDELIRRPDVDQVSVALSSLSGRPDPWSFDEVVDALVDRVTPLYLTAAAERVVLTLDVEAYRDVDLAIAVFTRVLEDPRLAGLEAGITLPSSLPDSRAALRELTAWATDRVEHGGARIAVRLVKGAGLALERVDAVLHGWPQATYPSALDIDANHLRLLDEALHPERVDAVRIVVADHDLFDIAYVRLLAEERSVAEAVEFEMALGAPEAQRRRVAEDVGSLRLRAPAVEPSAFALAAGYLAPHLAEFASPTGFLSAAFRLADDELLFQREQERFEDALRRAVDRPPTALPLRTQDRRAPVHESVRPPAPAPVADTDLTNIVLGISRGSQDQPFVETAVYSRLESAPEAGGAPGFVNAQDTDPALPANREWAHGIRERIATSVLGAEGARAARVPDAEGVDEVIAVVRASAPEWGRRPASERADVLLRVAVALEARRAELIEVLAAEAGVLLADGDAEVSAAADHARYSGAKARELDAVQGASFVPSLVTVVLAADQSAPVLPAGRVLAALAAGSGVVLVPAVHGRRAAAVFAETLWQSGIPRGLLALADTDSDLRRALIAHPDVDRVLLADTADAVAQVRAMRPDLPLLAETVGRSILVVTPSADLDQAAADLVSSAFSRAGQGPSSASLAILVGPVGRSARFARQLVDATRSLGVGWPSDAGVQVGPLLEEPQGGLAWALADLGADEDWLVRPEPAPGDETGRLRSPGIRVGVLPDARWHSEPFAGPVLGIMHAPTLARAIDLVNELGGGQSAGLHTQDPAELALWLGGVEAGSLFVNRTTAGARVQRQPYGGWKGSSVGAGAKSGGPNELIGLGEWRANGTGPASSTLHLRGLDARITDLIEAAQPSLDYERFEWLRRAALSDAIAWDREFGQVRDVSRLEVERNLFRYRPVPVWIRATEDAGTHELLRVVLAGLRAGSELFLSTALGLPAGIRHRLGELDVQVAVESDEEWIERLVGAGEDIDRPERPSRVRIVGSTAAAARLRRAIALDGDSGVAISAGEVTPAGRIELLFFVHEQSISITAHRFGRLDPWSADII